MDRPRRTQGLVLFLALVASLVGGAMLVWAPPAEAARCCKVMVCSDFPPYACWEECRPCPKFP